MTKSPKAHPPTFRFNGRAFKGQGGYGRKIKKKDFFPRAIKLDGRVGRGGGLALNVTANN